MTLGNHAFDQREALVFIERKPTNCCGRSTIPPGAPGRGAGLFDRRAMAARVLVVNVMGRVL